MNFFGGLRRSRIFYNGSQKLSLLKGSGNPESQIGPSIRLANHLPPSDLGHPAHKPSYKTSPPHSLPRRHAREEERAESQSPGEAAAGGKMVQRLTYRKRHSYATKSNQTRVVKTPGKTGASPSRGRSRVVSVRAGF